MCDRGCLISGSVIRGCHHRLCVITDCVTEGVLVVRVCVTEDVLVVIRVCDRGRVTLSLWPNLAHGTLRIAC